MKLLLTSNILEHAAYPAFLRAAGEAFPSAAVLFCGDLLNVFPEPGEDLEGSIFHELYGGDLITSEMTRLVAARFRGADSSCFLEPLRGMFLPTGPQASRARQIASARYERLFPRLEEALGLRSFYFIPGNMDYPRLAERASVSSRVRMFDQEVLDLEGIKIGGLGGIPNTVHPFRGVTEISPYEMCGAEYERRLRALWGVDVLVTHLSPEELPALRTFLLESPAKLLICRAPFDFTRAGDFRGKLETQEYGDKRVIKVRPFEMPGAAFVLELTREQCSAPGIEVFHWGAPPSA